MDGAGAGGAAPERRKQLTAAEAARRADTNGTPWGCWCGRACGGAWWLTFGLPEQRRGSGHEGMPGRKKGHASKLATMLRKLELEIRSISACATLSQLVRR